MTHITEYRSEYRKQFETFREKTFIDGNDSLAPNKINPDNFDGKIWCAWENDEFASIIALENDHYTKSPGVGRICRYHILSEFRNQGRYGFKMLDYLVPYARNTGYKLIYWTHDVNNKALNALYQHKKVFYDGGDNSYYKREPFTLLTLDRRWLFKVSPKSDLLQFVYVIKFDDTFEWIPNDCCVWREHDGTL